MRRFFAAWLLFVSLALAPAVSMSEPLWGSSRYGMSVGEVKSEIQGAVEVADGDSLSGGAKELLRLKDIEIAGEQFHASFFFLDGVLVQVMLSPQKKLTAVSGKVLYDEVITALRAKYGKEISSSNRGSAIRMIDYTWMSGRTNISATYVSVGAETMGLNISYQVRVAKSTNNL